jgi:hypothetical protein
LDDLVTYEKAVSHAGEPLLTLFRCTMKTIRKWWFISQVDKDKPGTDADINYYQHKSTSEEGREPQSYGWNNIPDQPISKVPAPTLERVGEIVQEGLEPKECKEKHISRPPLFSQNTSSPSSTPSFTTPNNSYFGNAVHNVSPSIPTFSTVRASWGTNTPSWVYNASPFSPTSNAAFHFHQLPFSPFLQTP